LPDPFDGPFDPPLPDPLEAPFDPPLDAPSEVPLPAPAWVVVEGMLMEPQPATSVAAMKMAGRPAGPRRVFMIVPRGDFERAFRGLQTLRRRGAGRRARFLPANSSPRFALLGCY